MPLGLRTLMLPLLEALHVPLDTAALLFDLKPVLKVVVFPGHILTPFCRRHLVKPVVLADQILEFFLLYSDLVGKSLGICLKF